MIEFGIVEELIEGERRIGRQVAAMIGRLVRWCATPFGGESGREFERA